jgi:predicted O-methyltransferase YrrM
VKLLQILLRYIRYIFTAGTRHDIHSPFVYHLYENVIQDRTPFYAFEKTEKLRYELKQNHKEIEVADYGAGSVVTGIRKKKLISEIAGSAVKSRKYGELLFRLVNHFRPETILELGTSLGISTLYLALPDSKSRVHTIEGCPQTAAQANEIFRKADVKNITLYNGTFENKLPEVLKKAGTIDFLYIDGNHRYAPTMDYFRQCLKKKSDHSVFVFDDIHWSAEMEKAWEEVKANSEVTLTIDLFFFGLVFFRKAQPKQHFVLRY